MPNTEDRVTNEVIVNGEVLLSTRNNTVTESTLAQNETAQDKTGHSITGEMDGGADAYHPTDPLSSNITDDDYIPFYSVSEQKKHNALFSRIVDRLKGIFITKSSGSNTSLNMGGDTLNLTVSDIDASKEDNNVTSTRFPSTANILDSEGRIITRFESVVNPNGNIGAKIYARNYNQNGDVVGQKGIQWHMDKSGNLTYQIDDYNAFRNAIKTVDQVGVAIPNKSNFDNYKTAGTYAVVDDSSAQTMFNIPVSVCGKLIVSNNGNGGYTQFYVQNHDAKVFIRAFWNNAWSAWSEIGSGGGGTHTYEAGREIPANSDFNSYTTAGVYNVATDAIAETLTNAPSNVAGKLIVYVGVGSEVEQVYMDTDNDEYSRVYDGSAWGDWKKGGSGGSVIFDDTTTVFDEDGDGLFHTYEVGLAIPANSDFDDYKTEGVYHVANNNDAATMTNCPATIAGKLIVSVPFPSTGNYYVQHYTTYWGDTYVRAYNGWNQTPWTEWIRIATSNDAYILKGGVVTGFISENDDLNNYTTAGTYDCKTAAIAATLSNSPVTGAAFKMMVDVENNSKILTQTITVIHANAAMPWRRSKDNSDSWGAWKQFASTSDIPAIGQNYFHYLSQPTNQITANQDLNDYTTSGTYQCNKANIAVTLSNCPVSKSFKLIVDRAYTDSRSEIMQKITMQNDATNSQDWVRIKGWNSSTWGNWISYPRVSSATYNNEDGVAVAAVASNGRTGSLNYNRVANHLVFDFHDGSSWMGAKTLANLEEIVTQQGVEIPANSDLDNYTTAGVYYISSNANAGTISNMPFGKAYSGKLIVMSTDTATRVIQMYITNYQDNNLVYMYARQIGNDGVARPWKEFASTSDISPSTIGDGYAVATVSGSTITATISGFQLKAGVIVVLQLPSSITVDSTLNISGTGAKSIYMRNNSAISVGTYLPWGVNTFMYDGTAYRHLGTNRTPTSDQQDYVANTSGSLILGWGYSLNLVHIKYNLALNKLRWNYYKNSTWRGDVNIADYDDINPTIAKVGKNILPSWSYTSNTYTSNGITYTFNPSTGEITANGTATNDSTCVLAGVNYSYYWLPKGSYTLSGCPSGGSSTKYYIRLNLNGYDKNDYGDSVTFDLTTDHESINNEHLYICVKSGQTVTNLVFKPMLRPSWTSDTYEPCEDIHKGNCYVGTCTTAADQQKKIAYVDGYFVLRKGVRVGIKFTNTNTFNATTSSLITLNVNSTGDKVIFTAGSATPTGTNTTVFGRANRYTYFIYDGTYWVWDGADGDNNSTNFLRNDASSTLTAASPYIRLKASDVDITQADNGVTATKYPVYIISDKNTKDMSRLECVVETNGNIATYLQVRNYKSDGTNPNGGLWVRMNKSGEVWYGMTNPHNFNAALGCGFATCTTAEATTAKVATLTNYIIATNGYVSVKFTYAVPASATLNINSQGAKSIYYRGAAIKANIIIAGDLATFIYNGSQYHLVGIDRQERYESISSFTVDSNLKTNASGSIFSVYRKGDRIIVRCDSTLTADYTVTSYGTDIVSGLPTASQYCMGSAYLIKNGVSEILPIQIHRSPSVLESIINKTITSGTALKIYIEYIALT